MHDPLAHSFINPRSAVEIVIMDPVFQALERMVDLLRQSPVQRNPRVHIYPALEVKALQTKNGVSEGAELGLMRIYVFGFEATYHHYLKRMHLL